jgi:hypothetical protein
LSRCTAIKASGDRCKGRAIGGSEWCYNHDPDHADERRRHGAKGGKRGGRGRRSQQAELADIKERLSDLADDVLEEKVDKGVGAVVSQILNTYIRVVAVALKVRETEELEERLQRLEAITQPTKGARQWHR